MDDRKSVGAGRLNLAGAGFGRSACSMSVRNRWCSAPASPTVRSLLHGCCSAVTRDRVRVVQRSALLGLVTAHSLRLDDRKSRRWPTEPGGRRVRLASAQYRSGAAGAQPRPTVPSYTMDAVPAVTRDRVRSSAAAVSTSWARRRTSAMDDRKSGSWRPTEPGGRRVPSGGKRSMSIRNRWCSAPAGYGTPIPWILFSRNA
jgi:hypothetical protein